MFIQNSTSNGILCASKVQVDILIMILVKFLNNSIDYSPRLLDITLFHYLYYNYKLTREQREYKKLNHKNLFFKLL